MDVLPGMIAPGANAVSFEPATHRAGRDGWKRWVLGQVLGHFGSTPAGHRRSCGTRQATSGGGDLGTHRRREKRLGAPGRGASASVWVLTQRLRHLRTCLSLVPTFAAICW